MQKHALRSPCSFVLATLACAVPACGDDGGGGGPDAAPRPDGRIEPDGPPDPGTAPQAVYILSNELDGNRVIVFPRAADGTLVAGDAFATGGMGSADGLGSQGPLVFDNGRLFAVNAGDHSISMLAVLPDGSLDLISHVPSGGVRPVSVTVRDDVVYVVNAGGTGTPANIAGFRATASALTPIASSSRPLSAAAVGPGQIEFSPDGAMLIVTEKMTNLIDTFAMTDGLPTGSTQIESAGVTPFGFAFSASGHLVVSEAAMGAPGMGTASSYSLAAAGALTPVSEAVPSTEAAPCWVEISGGHAFITNTASNSISAYTVSPTGALTLDVVGGVSARTSAGPIDLDITGDGAYLYSLASGGDRIDAFAISAGGGLTERPGIEGVSANAVGLVVR